MCTRCGTTVLSRDGYYTTPPTALVVARDTVQSDLNTAAVAIVPYTALPVQVEGAAGKYIVHVQSSGLTWRADPTGEQSAEVQVMAVALSAKNAVLEHHLQSMTAHSPASLNAASEKHDAAFGIKLTAPRNTKTVRFVVRDAATGHMGTVDLSPGQ